jgi:TolA-binding protein
MLTGLLQAQSDKVLIQQLQRDVAQLQNQLRQYTEGQDQKNANLEALLKQILDADAKLAANFGTVQQGLTTAMADQQGKLVQPINAVGSKVDQLSQSLSAIETSLDALTRRVASQDAKLTEILNNVRTISAAQQAPPPVPVSTQGTAATPTPGASADIAFQAAYRDLTGGRAHLAMEEFSTFIAQFPTSESAPKAQYYMGVIYDRDEDYENAVKAYDAVLERYPENPSTKDASYGKAVALLKLDRKVEAKKEFSSFLKKYPTDDNAAQAKVYLKELDGPAHPATRSQKGKR